MMNKVSLIIVAIIASVAGYLFLQSNSAPHDHSTTSNSTAMEDHHEHEEEEHHEHEEDHHEHDAGHHEQEEGHHEGQHEHVGAHVHGQALLQIVADNDTLMMKFESPAINIVGFERGAASVEELAAIKKAQAKLESPDSLFDLKSGKCFPTSSDVQLGALLKSSGHGDAGDNDGDSEGHSDVKGTYEFNCLSMEALTSLNVKLPVAFERIEALQVEWVIGSKQGAYTLRDGQTEVNLSR